jgi:hypothetical protein
LYPAMSAEQVHYVAQSVREIVQNARRAKLLAPGTPPLNLPAYTAELVNASEKCI